jgi:hypothetical protein
MNLRYIVLHMNHDSGYKDPFRDNFNLHSRFISNYLSIQIRKLKSETDGTFNMIAVSPTLNIKNVCRVVGEKALDASISFNRDAYEQMTEYEKYEYYLKLLENGYKICSQYKRIPLDNLLNLHQTFRENGYKNEWLHKKKKFKEYGIDVILNCFFTSFDFHLNMSVCDIKSKTEIVSGTVIRTLPDEVCFTPLYKDIIIENDKLCITEFQDRPKFVFNLSDIFEKKLLVKVLDVGLHYQSL